MGFVITGAAAGLNSLPGFTFDSNKPYVACMLCGKVYQPPPKINTRPNRNTWSKRHAKIHPESAHRQLRKANKENGTLYTPEAAYKLAAYGLISLTDLVLSQEHTSALKEAPAIPTDDAES